MTAPAFQPPLQAFNFRVDFQQAGPNGGSVPLCSGRFSEVSGIEATMEPKAIREGGRNFGEAQRAGIVKFSTVILKRGVTHSADLWTWFDLVAGGASALRLRARLVHLGPDGRQAAATWTLENALPVKFRAAAFSATASEVAIEELHFVHEAMALERGSAPS